MREGDVVASEFDSHDRQDRRLGRRPRRGPVPAPPGAGPEHGRGRGRDDQPVLPAHAARPARGPRRAAPTTAGWTASPPTAGTCPAPDPVALLVAAVEALRRRPQRRAGRLPRRRGPGPAGDAGRGRHPRAAAVLRRGAITSASTGPRPGTYRVRHGATVADVAVERLDEYERRVVCGGRSHRVLLTAQRAGFRIEVDGAAHEVVRDDGGVVRAGWPAFVVSVLVKPGDVVAENAPVAVLESMKMESTVVAPFAGEVASVDVVANVQVDAGAPLVRIRAADAGVAGSAAQPGATPVDLSGLVAPSPGGNPALRTRLRCPGPLPPGLRPRRCRPAPAADRAATARRDRAAGRRRAAVLRGRAARRLRRGHGALPAADRVRTPTEGSPAAVRRSTCLRSCSGSTSTGPACPTSSSTVCRRRSSGTGSTGSTGRRSSTRQSSGCSARSPG